MKDDEVLHPDGGVKRNRKHERSSHEIKKFSS
jgi:hypothetical protein